MLRLACALALVLCMLLAPGRAQAAAPGKQMLGAVPHHGGSAGAASPFASPLAPGFDLQPIPGPMTYHRGRVLHTSAVRTIYWIPAGYGVAAGYQGFIDGFLANVAADNGKTSNVYASDTQYYDSTLGYIQYSTSFLGGTVDTNPFPADATFVRGECYTGGTCLTDTELVNEIEAVKAANGWSGGLDTLYVILTPQNVNICVDWAAGVPCSTNTFCAYHSWDGLSSNPTIIYAVEPYFPIGEPGCDGGEHPNGNDADITINTLSHEHNEAITDPTFGGWYDAQGEENGDKCAFNFGARLGSTGLGQYNQVINGSFYFLQREWSNALNGCFQVGTPTVTGLSTLSAPAGADVGITGTNFFFPGGVGSVAFNGHASPLVTVDSPTHLTARVPGGAGVGGRITVQAVGGIGTSAQTFGVQPFVAGFAPTSGAAGQIVTVTGTGFFGVTAVKFNGVVAAVSSVAADGSSLTATVPVAATTGKVSVTTAGGTSQSGGDFTVLPKVSGFVPAAAVAGTSVTILGTGFSGTPTVEFAGDGGPVAATLVSHTATSLVVQVPATAINGPITVTTGDGASSSPTSFKPLPRITGFVDEPAVAGAVVTVNGANLTAAGALTAKLGVVAIVPGSLTATSFTFAVPDNGLTGAVSVTNANGTAASLTVVHVKPTITSLSSSEEAAGAHIQISGKTFTGTSAVKFFNNVPAAFVLGVGGTTLDVTVPAAAATGPITVTNAGGTATSGTFTVDPKVTALVPTIGVAGSNVTLSGTGLAGATEVDFAGAAAPAAIVSNTSTSVVVTVPADAVNGQVTVHVGPLSAQSPVVFKPLPKITGFVNEPTAAGLQVTVNGSNFTAGGTLTARLGVVALGIDSIGATSFQFTVPDTAVSGLVSVANANGTATSPTVVRVKPTISGDPAPNEGAAGAQIVLSGKTFTGTSAVKFSGNVPAVFTVGVGGTSLNVTVPAAAATGPISVTNAGGTVSTAHDFVVDPKVTGFVPVAAVAGGNVTILGTGFSGTPTVTFADGGSGAAATLVSHTATVLVVQVPATAVNGPITVTTAAGSSASVGVFRPLPKLTGFVGDPAVARDLVTVNGANLTANGTLTAKLGAVTVTPSSVGATGFQFVVPDNGLTGFVTVANLNGPASSPALLHMLPTISGDPAPNEAAAGAHIVLTGKTFTGTSAVKFGDNSQPALFTVGVGGTTLNVTVPANATTGKIGVTNAGGTVSTAHDFVVDPKVTGFVPVAALAGGNVTILGTGFSGTPTVTFADGASGVAATLVSHTPTSLVVQLPATAVNGPITVTTAAGSSASVGVFRPLPKLTGFVGDPAVAGDLVTVNGANLTANGTLTAKLGAVTVTPSSVGATSFQFVVPDNGLTGFVTIANLNGPANSPALLRVRPTIASGPTPDQAAAGTQVVLTGKTFTGTSAVKFGDNTEPAVFTVGVGGTTLNVTVPPNATTGKIGVTNAGGTALTSADFTVLPRVSGFVPVGAVAGTNVTIVGTGFSGTPTVTFADGGSGAGATLVSHTATVLVVQVPATAVNGSITVTTATGSSVGGGVFRPLPKLTGFVGDPAVAGDLVTVNGANLTANGALTAKLGAVTVTPISVGATSFQFVVPDNAVSGFVTIANLNGPANSPALLHVLPTISGDPAPNEGAAGAHIVLTGKTFTGTSAVKFFGNVPAVFTVGVGGTTLNVTVPAGAATGPISVTNAGGTVSTAHDFLIDPQVSGFVPAAGLAGSSVTILGTGFSGTPIVEFASEAGPVAATVVSHTATSLVVQLPATAVNGPITVTTAAGSSTSASVFKPLPKLTGFVGDPAVAGDLITVNGANLTANGTLSAKLGAVSVTPSSISATSFQFVVPDSAVSGPVTIANLNGPASSPAVLRVRPTITSGPTPDHAAAGEQVVLSGKTFTGTTAVKFGDNTEPAVFTVGVGGTSLNVTVPPNATSGKIGVTNAGGTSLTSSDFTVLPRVASFAPRSGGVGIGVTINGTGLAGVTTVDFGGGVSAVPDLPPTSTSVHVVVPPGAATGPLTVHSGAATSTSATPFNVNFSVTGISPTSGIYGTHVTLTGVGLIGVTQVKFNGLPGVIVSNNGTTIDATVPASGDVTGPVTIWVGAASIAAAQSFTLLSIGSLGPSAGFGGNDLTITGTGFAGATSVHIGSVAVPIGSNDGTHIHVSIPDTATTGPVTVTGPGGTATGPSLTVRAGLVLNEIAPNVSSGGTNTIELYATSAGEVGDVTLVANPGSDNQVVATLPSFTVAKGDLIVLHLGAAAAAPTHAGSVWELGVTGDVTYGDVVLELKNGTTVLDAVPFVDPALAAPAAFVTSINSLGGKWPACGSCAAAAAIAASVDWSGVGTTPTDPTAQRDFGSGAGADTNAAADWSVHPATFGAANR